MLFFISSVVELNNETLTSISPYFYSPNVGLNIKGLLCIKWLLLYFIYILIRLSEVCVVTSTIDLYVPIFMMADPEHDFCYFDFRSFTTKTRLLILQLNGLMRNEFIDSRIKHWSLYGFFSSNSACPLTILYSFISFHNMIFLY